MTAKQKPDKDAIGSIRPNACPSNRPIPIDLFHIACETSQSRCRPDVRWNAFQRLRKFKEPRIDQNALTQQTGFIFTKPQS